MRTGKQIAELIEEDDDLKVIVDSFLDDWQDRYEDAIITKNKELICQIKAEKSDFILFLMDLLNIPKVIKC